MSANCSFYLVFRPSESPSQRNVFRAHDPEAQWGPSQRSSGYRVYFVSWMTSESQFIERKYSVGEGDSKIMVSVPEYLMLWFYSGGPDLPVGLSVQGITSVADFKSDPSKLRCIGLGLSDTDYRIFSDEFEDARRRNTDLAIRITLRDRDNIEDPEDPVMVEVISCHSPAIFW